MSQMMRIKIDVSWKDFLNNLHFQGRVNNIQNELNNHVVNIVDHLERLGADDDEMNAHDIVLFLNENGKFNDKFGIIIIGAYLLYNIWNNSLSLNNHFNFKIISTSMNPKRQILMA